MKLFYSTASPYARTTQVVLREVGLSPEKHEVATHPFNNESAFIAANPLAKVPCLVLDNNQSIYDSEVIGQYLDKTFNGGKLWQLLAEDWSLRTVYSHVSGLLDICVALRQEKMREEEGNRSEFWWDRFVAGLDRGLIELNKMIAEFPESFSLLHINTICLLDYLSFRHPEINWRQHQSLEDFYQRFSGRESFLSTQPKA
ncbi:glutathione S-transferase family protein [Pleionea mediterranea]|uniref:Glutathione S-transferase n=1 Tax=Pleionea mediterranea TaxID=523701 RepID=A0A316FYN5_9GAMM|nr:glutathione S-transferase family protein [Pleionea mediterranea]PWK53771.1 glutathione S-transferase [Pleionea mediterranea]